MCELFVSPSFLVGEVRKHGLVKVRRIGLGSQVFDFVSRHIVHMTMTVKFPSLLDEVRKGIVDGTV